jgi:hypothetical protein
MLFHFSHFLLSSVVGTMCFLIAKGIRQGLGPFLWPIVVATLPNRSPLLVLSARIVMSPGGLLSVFLLD